MRILRDYEVSIWTLQDSFITVLKQANIEQKGQIQNPSMELKDDGTQSFSFKVPMYLMRNNQRIENPIWYNTRNGVIMADMRKVKVIINKNTNLERVFEFIITKVNESHQQDQLYCSVSCEGLAFHELGKIGYRISLTSDDFYNDDLEWFNGADIEQPRATLQYWNNKVFKNVKNWTYEINMNWEAFSQGLSRDPHKVYQQEYVSSWDNNLVPTNVENFKQKERLVDIEESNIYNITQQLAETFGVFCKYEYSYDENYHINGRKVIYYNNFLHQDFGAIDLTYPYTTSSVSRQMDGTDIITKMFVKPVTSQTTSSGLISIMDVGANKSGEDYLLNFDYLYAIGAITQQQYDEVKNYEKELRRFNAQLKPLEAQIVGLQANLPDLQAKKTIHENAIQLDQERISASNDLLNNLTGGTGQIEITAKNPVPATLLKDSAKDDGSYYINLSELGIIRKTLKIYRTYNTATKALSNRTKGGIIEEDEYHNIIRVRNIFPLTDGSGQPTTIIVWLTYKYNPRLYYQTVRDTWITRLNKDTAQLERVKGQIDRINNQLQSALASQKNLLQQKQTVINNFQSMMGPALREGFWQPDDYNDYGDKHTATLSIENTGSDQQTDIAGYATLFWDEVSFEDQLKLSDKITINQSDEYYPCIKLTTSQFNYIKNNIDTVSLLFYDIDSADLPNDHIQDICILSLGSKCELGFIKDTDNKVYSALIITGATGFTQETLNRMKDPNKGRAKIGTFYTELNSTTQQVDLHIDSNSVSVAAEDWMTITASQKIVYPRIKINSLALKNTSSELALSINSTPLVDYEDYYVMTRINESEAAYFITLKAKTLVKLGNVPPSNVKILYALSNADTSIYLDAIQVLKENAQPKVSYTIDVNVVTPRFIQDDYDKLGYIAHINDNDLKFENTFGYISQLTIDLDHPWEDKIVLKNYKTKFEDLFTKIVATTQQMKKNQYIVGLAAHAFTASGNLTPEVVSNSISKVDLNYAFNNGKLTISEQNGIWATSDSGVVAMRGGGIFTSTNKDSGGNWIWNTGITPEGINADLITTGQLDTNRIKIYAGDKLRLQMNGDGLYAYKSYVEDNINIISGNSYPTNDNDSYDSKQYVRFWQNGLQLVAKSGAHVLNAERTEYITIENLTDQDDNPVDEVKRVEISWDGLVLRNWTNKRVFYANPDTGDLTVEGTIRATNLKIGDSNEITDIDDLNEQIYKIHGSKLTVNANTGNIDIMAQNTINIAANKQLNILTNGLLSITGNEGVSIDSSSKLQFTAADTNGSHMRMDKDGIFFAAGAGENETKASISDAITLSVGSNTKLQITKQQIKTNALLTDTIQADNIITFYDDELDVTVNSSNGLISLFSNLANKYLKDTLVITIVNDLDKQVQATLRNVYGPGTIRIQGANNSNKNIQGRLEISNVQVLVQVQYLNFNCTYSADTFRAINSRRVQLNHCKIYGQNASNTKDGVYVAYCYCSVFNTEIYNIKNCIAARAGSRVHIHACSGSGNTYGIIAVDGGYISIDASSNGTIPSGSQAATYTARGGHIEGTASAGGGGGGQAPTTTTSSIDFTAFNYKQDNGINTPWNPTANTMLVGKYHGDPSTIIYRGYFTLANGNTLLVNELNGKNITSADLTITRVSKDTNGDWIGGTSGSVTIMAWNGNTRNYTPGEEISITIPSKSTVTAHITNRDFLRHLKDSSSIISIGAPVDAVPALNKYSSNYSGYKTNVSLTVYYDT